MKVRKLTLTSFLLLTAAPSLAQDRCDAVLSQGIFNTTEFRSEDSFRQALTDFLRTSHIDSTGTITNASYGSRMDLVIEAIPVGSAVDASYGRNYFRTVRDSLQRNQTVDIDESAVRWVKQQIASEAVVQAWRDCMMRNGRGGLHLDTHGDTNGEFNIVLSWLPNSAADAEARSRVTNVSVTNADPVGDPVLISGAALNPFGGIAQTYRRRNRDDIAVSITAEGMVPVSTTIAWRAPGVPATPLAVFVDTMMDHNPVTRAPYVEEISWNTRNRPPNPVTMTFNLKDREGVIPNVRSIRRVCRGTPVRGGRNNTCDWAIPDQRRPLAITNGGRSFVWRATYGGAVEESFTVQYRKLHRVCVENCPVQHRP